MTASEKRAFVRGYALARAHMSRQLRATKVKFDNDVDELRADIADIKAEILNVAAELDGPVINGECRMLLH
jgi:hypothetical protein